MPHLTKTMVDDAKPNPSRQTFLWDTKLKGFGLRVSPGGAKAYVYQYRPVGNTRTARCTIGRHGPITCDQARKLATKLAADIVHGADPAAKKAAAKAEMTVSILLDKFIAEHVTVNNKPGTLREETRLINRLLKPSLGTLRLSELTKGRVKAWHTGTAAKTSANRALAHLQRACRFAIELDVMTENPCRSITRNKEVAKDRYFTDDELTRIGQALKTLEAEHAISPAAADGIRLLALTGMRAGEVRGLRWTDFDRMQRLLRLGDAKAGTRPVLLCPEAFALLSSMNECGPFIIAGSDPSKACKERAFSKAMERVLEQAKIEGGSLHTFRHGMATFMAQNGVDAFLIAKAGGWKTLSMVQRYVSRHAIGELHPLTAGKRISIALSGDPEKIVTLGTAA